MLPRACDLPRAWAGSTQWRLLAAGRDAALDFLATWQAWRDDPQRPRLLHFAGITPSPVSPEALLRGAPPPLQPLARQLAERWQGLLPGFHRFAFEDGRVLLTLCVGELQTMLREQAFRADTVFLAADACVGSARAIARLCRRGTLVAGAGVATLPDLASCGFETEAQGARYSPRWEVKSLPEHPPATPGDCIVVGAGLAGAAAAASLARRGWSVQVLDAATAPAAGASALPAGLLAPHQSPDDNLLSRLSRGGIRIALQECGRLLERGTDWDPTGVLEHRQGDARALPPLGAALEAWSREALATEKEGAGLAATQPAWWHALAAWVRPAALVQAWLRQPGVVFRGGCAVARIAREDGQWQLSDAGGRALARAPLVVVAAAGGSAALLAGCIATHPVRGQVSWNLREPGLAALPPFPVNGHGHFLPDVPLPEGRAWLSGSTYGRRDADGRPRDEDHLANLQRLQQLVPQAAAVLAPQFAAGGVRAWSGVRHASTDRRPLVGEVETGLWVSTALGSRGLTFAALAGEWIAARLHGEPWPLPARLAEAIDVRRQLAPDAAS